MVDLLIIYHTECLENIASEAKGFILVGLRYSWNFPVTDNCDADI